MKKQIVLTKKKKPKFIRFLEYRILHIQDTPHRIALGVAIGLFIVPNPLLGLHIVMVLGLCVIFNANKLAAFTSTLLSNIFTIVPFYYASYVVGYKIISIYKNDTALTKQQISQLIHDTFMSKSVVAGIINGDYWHGIVQLLKAVGVEIWLGSSIIAIVMAVAGYMVSYKIVNSHRNSSPHRRYRRVD